MGHYADGQHGSNAPGDVEMARVLPAGTLDRHHRRHSQNRSAWNRARRTSMRTSSRATTVQPDQQNGTWIMQAHEWKYVGRAQFDYQNGKLTLTGYETYSVNLVQRDGKNNAIKDDNGNVQFIQDRNNQRIPS